MELMPDGTQLVTLSLGQRDDGPSNQAPLTNGASDTLNSTETRTSERRFRDDDPGSEGSHHALLPSSLEVVGTIDDYRDTREEASPGPVSPGAAYQEPPPKYEVLDSTHS